MLLFFHHHPPLAEDKLRTVERMRTLEFGGSANHLLKIYKSLALCQPGVGS